MTLDESLELQFRLQIRYFQIGLTKFVNVLCLKNTLQLGHNKWNIFLPAASNYDISNELIFFFHLLYLDVKFVLGHV